MVTRRKKKERVNISKLTRTCKTNPIFRLDQGNVLERKEPFDWDVKQQIKPKIKDEPSLTPREINILLKYTFELEATQCPCSYSTQVSLDIHPICCVIAC